MDTWVYVAESLCYSPENIATLQHCIVAAMLQYKIKSLIEKKRQLSWTLPNVSVKELTRRGYCSRLKTKGDLM